ncbi:MAG: ribonuclease D [Candidatus Promineifilaceae bacterium]
MKTNAPFFNFPILIEDPNVEKVLHASEYDLILMRRKHGWHLNNMFDTMWAARILGYTRIGLASMLGELYGLKLDKKYQRANWCQRPLTRDQLDYAQTDTHFLLRMRDDLEQMLREHEKIEEATETFGEQTNIKMPDVDFSADSFWSINGIRSLSPRQKALLRDLNIYRNDEARRRDRPAFKVFSDKTLLEIAAGRPRSLHALRHISGLTDRVIRRYGRHILQIVHRSSRSPIPTPPVRTRPPEDIADRYEHLHQWRKEHARERGVASDVVISREALWAIARANPHTMDELSELSQLGVWRCRTYGQHILDVLENTR